MSQSSIFNSVIQGVGHFVPEKIVTNQDLEKFMETSDEWITERTGIKQRRFAEDGIGSSDIAILAADLALKDAKIERDEVDMIIAATLSPDYFFPGIGVMIQKKMGLKTVPALDIRAQCSGLVYAMSTAHAFIRSGQAKKILLCCAEIQHPVLDLRTEGRDMAVLFGDGAGALVVCAKDGSQAATAQNKERGVIDSILGSDGGGADVLTMKIPGSANPGFMNVDQTAKKEFQPRMDGRQVFKHAVTRMVETATILLKRNGLKAEDVNMLFPHQANLRINEMVREHLGIPADKVFNNIQKYGNTTAATIPIAMSEARAEGKLKEGDLILTLAFGAGFTWGANLIRY